MSDWLATALAGARASMIAWVVPLDPIGTSRGQRHRSEGPAGQRIAIEHGLFEGSCGGDEGTDIERIENPAVERGQQLRRIHHPVPSRPVDQLTRHEGAGHRPVSVDEAGGVQPRRYRVCDHLPRSSAPLRQRHRARRTPRSVASDEHRSAVGERRNLGDAAPNHLPLPHRRSLTGKEHPADAGADAIRADQVVGLGRSGAAGAMGEGDPHPAGGQQSEVGDPGIGADAPPAESFLDGGEQHHLEVPTVHGQLRPSVTGRAAPRLTPDHVTVPAGIDQLGGRDGGPAHRSLEAEVREFPNGIGKAVDPGTEGPDLRGCVDHPDVVETGRVQAQGRGQDGDARPGDETSHRRPSLLVPCSNAGRRRVSHRG
ncbi:hypothetical protein [Micromonospora sp. NPDC005324]|uniref:hypothetical protein n=1 Tax=Micromonospora sp. NPDC005324 TaxID=3157033 RepID=UPI0033B5C7F0